jgi:hypothetical protein
MARPERTQVDVIQWPWLAAAGVGALFAVYLVIFLSVEIGGAKSSFTRIQLFGALLLPEEVLANAVGNRFGWQGVVDRAIALGGAAAGLWCALWLGWWPLRWIGGADERPWWERSVLAAGLGLHLISLWTLAVGLAGLLRSPVLAASLAVAGVVLPIVAWRRGAKGVGSLFRQKVPLVEATSAEKDSRPGPSARPPRGPRPLWLAGLAVAAVFAMILLLGAALPPWDFDVREYHLQVPKEWYQSGRIEFLAHNVYANMPLGAEMFPLAAMSVLGDWWLGAIVGKTLMGACAVLTAAAIYGQVRHLASPPAAMAAAIAWISHPWANHVSIQGLNEQVYALYVILAVSAAAFPDASRRRWVLAGVFAGAAAACKYPAVVMLVMPVAALAIVAPRGLAGGKPACGSDGGRSASWRLRATAAGCFLVAAALSAGAWYIKNAVQAGNPVYPLLANVLGGKTRTPAKNEQFARGHAVPPYSPSKLAESAARIGWRSEHQSPLLVPLALLGCAVLLVRSARRNAACFMAALLAFFLAAWWLFTHRIDRFLVPAIPLAAVLAGAAVEYALSRPLKWAVGGLLLAGLLYNLAYVCWPMPLAQAALAGDNRWLLPLAALRSDAPRREGDLSRVNADIRWLNANVPLNRGLVCIGEAAVFDLEMPVYYHTCFDDCLLVEWMAGKSAAERKRILREKNVAAVYVDWAEIERYRGSGNYGFDPRFSRDLVQELVAQQVLAGPQPNAPPETYFVLP